MKLLVRVLGKIEVLVHRVGYERPIKICKDRHFYLTVLWLHEEIGERH